jgi:hypothetical protein
MKSARIFTVGAMLALTSCGAMKEGSADSSQQTQQKATPTVMPDAAVIAVPVGSNGQEMTAQADMRIIPNAQANISGDAIAAAFNAGHKPDAVVDEMDATSSTESCRGWFNFRNFGQYGGWNGYRNYQPTYYYGGNPYSWQYQNSYQAGGTNYYYYYRQQQSYNQYGYNQNPYGQNPYGQNPYGQGNYYGGQVQPIGYY